MFGFARESHDQVYNGQHEGKLTHELVAGGAGFAAMKYFENQQRKEVSHGFAKEMLAGFAAAEVDKLVETKGLDFVDREKAKHDAKRQAEHLYDQQYSSYDQFDPQQSQPHGVMSEYVSY